MCQVCYLADRVIQWSWAHSFRRVNDLDIPLVKCGLCHNRATTRHLDALKSFCVTIEELQRHLVALKSFSIDEDLSVNLDD